MNKFLVVLVLFLSTAFAGCGGSSGDGNTIPNLTSAQKEEDFEYLCGILSENYPYFEVNKRVNGIDWLGNKNSYKSKISASGTNLSYAVELYNAVKDLKCGHADVLMDDFSMFADVYLGNFNSATSIEPWKAVFTEAKPFYDDYWIPLFRSNSNAVTRKTPDPSVAIVKKTLTDGSAASFKIIESGKTAYMNVSAMAVPTDAEYSKILAFYTQIKDYPNLIIDIRENSGGDDYYWAGMIIPPLLTSSITGSVTTLYRSGAYIDPFLKAREIVTTDISLLPDAANYPAEYKTNFTRFYKETGVIKPDHSVGFSGKIFVLTSGKVFSSSEAFAMFCKQTGFATIVGTVTGG
ncbi:MAG TPA: S41 family peptidase, partial [Spirochaetota bacterium]|nr:S41 family peptidase [Spirochaetota bacterium]